MTKGKVNYFIFSINERQFPSLILRDKVVGVLAHLTKASFGLPTQLLLGLTRIGNNNGHVSFSSPDDLVLNRFARDIRVGLDDIEHADSYSSAKVEVVIPVFYSLLRLPLLLWRSIIFCRTTTCPSARSYTCR